MVASDVLKEYLVKLGFAIDGPAQAKLKQALQELESQLNGLAKNKSMAVMTKGFLGFIGVIGTAAVATGAMVKQAADADMTYQKLALRLHMTKDAAKQMTIAQEALGASLEEIVWNPELRKQYHELRQTVRDTSAPASEQFKFIREIGFEFTKMTVLLREGANWISMHLTNMLGGRLQKIQAFMRRANEWLKENMPKWTKWIADFLYRVIGVGEVVIRIAKGIFDGFKAVVGILPPAATGLVAFFAAIAMGLKLNPVILMLAGLFLILEDYFVFLQGGKTVFGNIWANLDKMFLPMKNSLEELSKAFEKAFGGKSFNQVFWDTVTNTVKALASGVAALAYSLSFLIRVGAWALDVFSGDKGKQVGEKYQGQLKELRKEYGIDTSSLEKGYTSPEGELRRAGKSDKIKEYLAREKAIKDAWKLEREHISTMSATKFKEGVYNDRATLTEVMQGLWNPAENYEINAARIPMQTPTTQSLQGQGTTINIGELNLPGVTNAKDFVNEMQKMQQLNMVGARGQ